MLPNILIEEQGLRDGLQTLPITIDVENKIEWVNMLIAGGLKRIQVTSFVNPKLVPQLSDAAEVIKRLPKKNDVVFSALVLNLKGVERAIEAGIKHLSISISASNTHSLKNANKTIEAAKEEFKRMVTLALANGITIRGGIQCAFGCRYEGVIDENLIYNLVQDHLETGVQEIALADSTGMGNPYQVKRMMQKVKQIANETPVALHLHNSENKGYANVIAALDAGVTQFDTAFGGLGGCPFIKNATGNIATEDTVHLLHQLGYTTNINIKEVSKITLAMEALLNQNNINSQLHIQGLMYKLVNQSNIKII
ncbi:MAG: hydroxymethylglutaryl-CoA lyase [Chitinophagaceae bacterium]|jgi:hydroxymethylglutaryl-CoA lyase